VFYLGIEALDGDILIDSIPVIAYCPFFIYRFIDFQKNNFSLFALLPKILYLNGARARLNTVKILFGVYIP
jgi:hypothetical protein